MFHHVTNYIIGTGGAFDPEEGNSSFFFYATRQFNNLLVDCGWATYPRLKKLELIKDVDTVFVSHCHDDHIGSLSVLIYDRWFIHKKKTEIITLPTIKDQLEILLKIFGHTEDQFRIFGSQYIIDTTDKHVKGMPTCGVLFDNSLDQGIIISGDINEPIFDSLSIFQKNFVSIHKKKLDIYHEATTTDYEGNVHCNYKKLIPFQDEFVFYTYHHNKKSGQEIEKESKLKSLSV